MNFFSFFFAFRFFSGFSSSFYCAIETDLHAFNFYLVTQDCYCLSIVVHFHCIIIFFYFFLFLFFILSFGSVTITKAIYFYFEFYPRRYRLSNFSIRFSLFFSTTWALTSTGKQIAHALHHGIFEHLIVLENVSNAHSEVSKRKAKPWIVPNNNTQNVKCQITLSFIIQI